MNKPEYLGDGAYADFNGYQIELRANRHDDPNPIYLEPIVLAALVKYARKVMPGIRLGDDEDKGATA